jgi:hypothetical protein
VCDRIGSVVIYCQSEVGIESPAHNSGVPGAAEDYCRPLRGGLVSAPIRVAMATC